MFHTAGSKTQTLADTSLPRRARHALERLLVDLHAEMGQQIPQLLQETELALARATPSSDAKLENDRLASMRSLGGGGQAFTRRFMAGLEASLANLQTARRKHDAPDAPPVLTLSLLDDDVVSDEATLANIANRVESRNSLGLQLLGQRFGVLAGAPAFESETLPLGPLALCNALADAADGMQLSRYARMQLFQQFERAMAEFYPPLLDTLNMRLAEDGILPYLSYVPVRVRPGSAAPAAILARQAADENAGGGAPATPAGQASGHGAGHTPGHAAPHAPAAGTAPMGSGEAGGAIARAFGQTLKQLLPKTKPAVPGFAALQTLLQRRRVLLAKLRPGDSDERVREPLQHNEVLDALQRMRNNATKANTLGDYRQILLAQARQLHGHGVALSDIDNDSFDLLTLFFAQLQRGLRKPSPGYVLVERLRLPLAQLALRDQRFFTDASHPARQLLGAVSLAGAHWLAEDDLDNQWLGLLQRAVTSVQQDSDGALDTFVEANQTLQSGLQALARKAEMAERRQVEAARGREKLAVARQQARAKVDGLLQGRSLPRFHAILVEHAWMDVLSLTHLRGGEHSDGWQQLLDATRRILDACTSDSPDIADMAFFEQVRGALEQVGYHADDAGAIARQLTNGPSGQGDMASRTELLVQLRARARLGEGSGVTDTDAFTPLSPEERLAGEELRTLKLPVWVELDDAGSHPLRRRLAWVSRHTPQVLLVNRRGLRVGSEDLDALTRLLTTGGLRLLAQDTTPADDAWDATLDNLQHITPADASDAQEDDHGD